MRIRATVVKALAAGALLTGVLGGRGALINHAATINNFYVATNGLDANNSCTNKTAPCQTLEQAVDQADLVNPTGPNTINIARGTYSAADDAIGNVQGQQNLVVVGKSSKSGKNLVTIGEAGGQVLAGNTNTTVENLTVIDNSGGTNGITLTAGTTLANTTVGATSAPNNAVVASGATVTNVTVQGSICADVTKSGVAANAPAGTLVTLQKKFPACAAGSTTASSGTVTIQIAQDGRKSLQLTSANGATAIPAGATLAFASNVAAYHNASPTGQAVGVACASCTITGSHVNGSGEANQVGIAAIAAGGPVTIQGNSVSGNGLAGIAAQIAGAGFGTVNIGGATAGQGNTGSSNGAGIAVDGAANGNAASNITNVVDNSVGGVLAGLSATCITAASGAVSVSGNTASASALKAVGIGLLGVQNQSFTGNTATGTIGVLAAAGAPPTAATAPAQECTTADTGNTITGNTVNNNILEGFVITGALDPVDVTATLVGFGISNSQAGNGTNTITGNSWSGNGGTSGANFVDLSAFKGQVAPACNTPGQVTTTAAIAAATAITSVSLHTTATCTLNPGTNLNATGPGINQTLYITSSCTLLSTATSTTCSVSNFIPLASSQLNVGGLASGSTLLVDAFTGTFAPANTDSPNSPSPDYNGNANLDSATGSGGYYSA